MCVSPFSRDHTRRKGLRGVGVSFINTELDSIVESVSESEKERITTVCVQRERKSLCGISIVGWEMERREPVYTCSAQR